MEESWIGAPPFEPRAPKKKEPKAPKEHKHKGTPAEQCREYQCLHEEVKLAFDRSLFAMISKVHGTAKARDLDAGAFHDLAARVYHEVHDIDEV